MNRSVCEYLSDVIKTYGIDFKKLSDTQYRVLVGRDVVYKHPNFTRVFLDNISQCSDYVERSGYIAESEGWSYLITIEGTIADNKKESSPEELKLSNEEAIALYVICSSLSFDLSEIKEVYHQAKPSMIKVHEKVIGWGRANGIDCRGEDFVK